MDNKSKALGYLVGKQIAGMRRVTKEPVAWLYNGVRLPPLPECYGYGYAIVRHLNPSDDADGYRAFAYLSKTPFVWSLGKIKPPEGSLNYLWYDQKAADYWGKDVHSEWVYDSTSDGISGFSSDSVTWTSHDILNSSGSITYVYGSEPVPVYE